ncbi:MAG: peptide chain release factor N(5)-glutamine methyltransferase [Lentisphaeria bacterium]|nr:peptide chain release factor N(5)-glutamine methyltransferase [Lentisphaeria bacterium]
MTALNFTEAIRILQASGIANARREAGWLLEQIIGSGAVCSGRPLAPLSVEQAGLFRSRLLRRASGEPLQYIMGNTDFHCLQLDVGPGVLIPRPGTEQLVEIAIGLYPGHGAVCDLCTGSGAIALALAKTFPQTDIQATDISEPALSWARRNRERLQLGNVTFRHGDLLAPFPVDCRFTLITANPPYISGKDYERLDRTVKDHEPREALLADDDGLAVIKRLAEEARGHLAPQAWLLCEIGEEQGPPVAAILRRLGYQQVEIRRDYADRNRFALARHPSTTTNTTPTTTTTTTTTTTPTTTP